MEIPTPAPWGSIGWLASDEYESFWASVLVNELREFIENKKVIDIGAGNGAIWRKALLRGLKISSLELLDPQLDIDASSNWVVENNILLHKKDAKALTKSEAQIAFFKQSFHLIYRQTNGEILKTLEGKTSIVLYMPHKPDFPFSPILKGKFVKEELLLEDTLVSKGKKIIDKKKITFPVNITRQEWINMIRARFISLLHSAQDEQIKEEVLWIQKNLPDKLEFSDTLFVLVFK